MCGKTTVILIIFHGTHSTEDKEDDRIFPRHAFIWDLALFKPFPLRQSMESFAGLCKRPALTFGRPFVPR